MELKVKSGKGLACGYTGEPSNVLVKICVERDDGKEVQSEWVCRDALEAALRIMDAAEGRPQSRVVTTGFVTPSVSFPAAQTLTEVMPEEAVGGAAPAARPKSPSVSAAHAALVEVFRDACQELADNPPADQHGNPKLSELHIRELIAKYKNRLPNPALFEVVNDVFGMSKDRFNVSIGNY